MRRAVKNGINALVRLSRKGNMSISGIKGSGKDVVQGNIVARKQERYASNVDYTKDDRYIKLDLMLFNLNGNTWEDFINGTIKPYKYPYEDGVDVIISDAGIVLPSQYDSYLDKKYPSLATWSALQRQLNDGQLHFNSQSHARVWKKLREQCADHFIRCDWCKVFFGNQGKLAKLFTRVTKLEWRFGGFVVGTYYYYDKESSCINRVKPCRIRKPSLLASQEAKMMYHTHVNSFYNTYGTVEYHWYICINKSKHNSRIFKEVMENVQYQKKTLS